jgi:hypothetical protein
MPRDRFHPMPAGEETPRVIAIGSSSWLRDEIISRRTSARELFMVCVAWLRARTANTPVFTDIPDKKRDPYSLNISADRFYQASFLPLGLMVLGVVAVGTGVWVVRRR